MTMITLRDLADSVRRVRPDARDTGLTISDEHVQAARLAAGAPRYEEIEEDEDDGVFDEIVERAVAFALADDDEETA